jgi:hypothetical protein
MMKIVMTTMAGSKYSHGVSSPCFMTLGTIASADK